MSHTNQQLVTLLNEIEDRLNELRSLIVPPSTSTTMPPPEDFSRLLIRRMNKLPKEPLAEGTKLLTALRITLLDIFPQDLDRRAVLEELFGVRSTKDVSTAQASELLTFLDRDSDYVPDPNAVAVLKGVLPITLANKGQLPLTF